MPSLKKNVGLIGTTLLLSAGRVAAQVVTTSTNTFNIVIPSTTTTLLVTGSAGPALTTTLTVLPPTLTTATGTATVTFTGSASTFLTTTATASTFTVTPSVRMTSTMMTTSPPIPPININNNNYNNNTNINNNNIVNNNINNNNINVNINLGEYLTLITTSVTYLCPTCPSAYTVAPYTLTTKCTSSNGVRPTFTWPVDPTGLPAHMCRTTAVCNVCGPRPTTITVIVPTAQPTYRAAPLQTVSVQPITYATTRGATIVAPVAPISTYRGAAPTAAPAVFGAAVAGAMALVAAM